MLGTDSLQVMGYAEVLTTEDTEITEEEFWPKNLCGLRALSG